jgi:2-C-methyl-D-erythritol 4-phosphate cytidylyltransferase
MGCVVGWPRVLSQFIRLTRRFKKVRAVVAGGAMRSDSVKCGLRRFPDTDIVLVHDAARPFVDRGYDRPIDAALRRIKQPLSACRSNSLLRSQS